MPNIGIVLLGILEIAPTVPTKLCSTRILCTTGSTGDGTSPQSCSTIPTKFCTRHIFVPAFGTLDCLYIFRCQDFIPYLLKFQYISKSFHLKIILNKFIILYCPFYYNYQGNFLSLTVQGKIFSDFEEFG